MSDPEATLPPQPRRYADQRIDVLEEGVARLEVRVDGIDKKMDEQTAILGDVRDILGTFRIIGATAKWLGYIAGAFTAAGAAVASWLHFGGGNGPR